jgi:hypothetical protein
MVFYKTLTSNNDRQTDGKVYPESDAEKFADKQEKILWIVSFSPLIFFLLKIALAVLFVVFLSPCLFYHCINSRFGPEATRLRAERDLEAKNKLAAHTIKVTLVKFIPYALS